MFLVIANPLPNADGFTHTRISLYHAERHFKRGRAYLDEQGQVVFCYSQAHATDQAERLMIARVRNSACVPPVRDLPMCMSNLTGTSLWPVIPNYTEGRPFKDFLVTVARAKASRNSSSGPEGKQ